jgi:hypothetical protein
MPYTFDTTRKDVTGFGQSIILKAVECGQIGATNNLLGNWKVEYREPHQAYLPPLRSTDRGEGQASAVPDAPLLETEIAALVREAEGSLRRHDADHDHTAAANDDVTATQSINFESKVNEPRRPWHPDIRIDDPERAAKAVSSSSPQSTYAVIGVLLGASVTGWFVGVPPFLIDGHHSIPVEQKAGSSGGTPGAKDQTTFAGPETGRPTNPGVPSAGKIAAPAPGTHGHRHGYAKTAAQRPDAIRTSAVAQQSTAPSEPVASDFGRRSRFASSQMPFPETRPETIEGWTVRDVFGATAVLEGPDGVWRAARGDTVPHVGRVESIVRWGNRWIVMTSSGLISTP